MMNHSATNNTPPTMSIKNCFSPIPQKISPMSINDSMNKNPTTVEEMVAPPRQKPVHTPIYGSVNNPAAKEIAAPARPQKKPVHHHQKSIGTKGRATATGIVDGRRVALLQNNQERISVRTLRRIKRRLFLEALNSEQHSIGTKGSAAATGTVRIKSPRNVVSQYNLQARKTGDWLRMNRKRRRGCSTEYERIPALKF